MSVLLNLISHNDCISWIPTIRGALSLDLIDDAKSVLGDVDKYSVRFKKINGFHSEHYVIASSLHTVNDRKVGKDYERTFRYIFTGSINNKEIEKDYLEKYQLTNDEKLTKYIGEEGLFIGHLIIVAEETHKLSDLEVTFLRNLKELNKINRDFYKKFYVEAVSMEILEAFRSNMFLAWDKLCNIACQIEKDDKNKRPTFCFDVTLTRDGILLLKDTTSPEYRNYYAAPGTHDDYTKNIPIHRLFKDAMNYVKYLFHSNYHHNEYNDTYLPSSNLHPAKVSGTLNLQKVFKHQLDAFLVPVIKLKRNNFKSNTIKPEGILLYAKSFIKVFESNNLVEQSVTSKANGFCDNLLKEVELMNRKQSTLISAVISQHNWFVNISALLAFALTCLKLYSIYVYIEPMKTFDATKALQDIGVVMALMIFGYILYKIPRSRILSKQFKLKSRKNSILFVNSNLKRARFSRLYELYIDLNTLKLYIRKITILLTLQTIIWLALAIISIIIGVLVIIL